MIGIKQYIYIALALIALAYMGLTSWQINNLESENDSLKKDILVADVNYIECDETIKKQNTVIENLEVDYNQSILEFDEYKLLPAKVKIKEERIIIYRDVNTTKTRKERNCEEYKTIESNTYMLDWNK
ncbi:hypothetical protein [Sulfurimonas sp.]|uniref:hypothetical protein n=1 Tax=Sulfurimonas sp. TaxID=2022749 RepID=UPI002B49AB34|nr:hypothetical protein [Sulfurimonas sp.]